MAEEAFFLGIALPVAMQIGCGMASMTSAFRAFNAALPYLFFLFISYISHLDMAVSDLLTSAIILMNLVLSFWFAAVLGSWKGEDFYPKIMRYVAVLSFPIFLYVAVTQRNALVWGRWEPYGIQPNWWGMMALGLGWCSLAWKNLYIRFLCLFIVFYFFFQLQARGAIIAFLPVLFFCSRYFLPLTKKRMLILTVSGMVGVLCIVLAVTFSHSISAKVSHYLANDVMKVNDPNRGLNSGLTGRTTAYIFAWQAFLNSPIIGNGFSEFGFVHNGFLITLAESGVFAFLSMLFLLGCSLQRFIRARQWVGMGYILSYIFTIMTYPRTFNINITSLLFIMVLMKGIALRPEKTALLRTNNGIVSRTA